VRCEMYSSAVRVCIVEGSDIFAIYAHCGIKERDLQEDIDST